jgi:hypothetical protein
MSEPDNLVLELLRGIRSDLSGQGDLLREHGIRLTEIASAVAGLRRDQAFDAETSAHLAARVDKLRDDVDRIKRRLDLSEA